MPKKSNLTQELSNKIIYHSNNCETMMQAAKECGLSYTSFKRYAKKLGVYKPSDHIKALRENGYKSYHPKTIPLNDIIYENNHPNYCRSYLKKRLIKENYFEEKCSKCNITEWNGDHISFHLDHIDGDSRNHYITNLRLLCPNCHSQTDTFCRGQRHTIKNTANRVSDEVLLDNIPKYTSVRQVLLNSGVTASQANYHRVDKLIEEHNLQLKEKVKKEKPKIKGKKKIEYPTCKVCGTETKERNVKYCSYYCMGYDTRKVRERPSKEQLLFDLKHSSYVEVGRKYSVSDNAIRKWLK